MKNQEFKTICREEKIIKKQVLISFILKAREIPNEILDGLKTE